MKFKILGVLNALLGLSLLYTGGKALLFLPQYLQLVQEFSAEVNMSSVRVTYIVFIAMGIVHIFLGVRVFQNDEDDLWSTIATWLLVVTFVGSGLALWYVNSQAYSSVQEVLSTSTGV